MITPIIFATMRRSGSHFCMHRALASVKFEEQSHFGIHVNSIGSNKLFPRKKAIDVARNLISRKQNHYYNSEQRAYPYDGDHPFYPEAAYACLSGNAQTRWLNPSGLEMKFLAINIEDENVDSVYEKAGKVLLSMKPFVQTFGQLPVFVTLRSLRSIALSREKWLEKHPRNIMASGFARLNIDVWKDHYESVKNGKTKKGTPVIGLHYASGVETSGQSIVEAFRSSTNGVLNVRKDCPAWIKGSVLSDGGGSSFVGAGVNRFDAVRNSLIERKPLLEKYSYLFEKCPEAFEHEERYGEL